MTYESPLAYESSRIHAAAVYCSDGRVGEHIDDFLHNGLRLPRYDRLAVPGGPACIAGHAEAHIEQQGVVDELKFLVENHGVTRIVLIAHQGCAFYAQRLRLPERFLEAQQQIDLAKAAGFIREITGQPWVDAYFARLKEGRVAFEDVPTA